MTTAIIRFKENDQVELSSDRLVVGGHTGIRYENKIITKSNSEQVSTILYAGKRIPDIFIWDLNNPHGVQQMINDLDINMQVIYVKEDFRSGVSQKKYIMFITHDQMETITRDFAIGSGAETAIGLLRYSKNISTKEIYKIVSSLDLFTSQKFDSVLL